MSGSGSELALSGKGALLECVVLGLWERNNSLGRGVKHLIEQDTDFASCLPLKTTVIWMTENRQTTLNTFVPINVFQVSVQWSYPGIGSDPPVPAGCFLHQTFL